VCFFIVPLYAFILEYLFASGLFKRGHLQVGRLVVGGCSRIAYFHAPILLLTYATRNTLISWGRRYVANLTLCATNGKKNRW
jgi:hypothetical protein